MTDSSTLKEVVRHLEAHKRFISPVIKNLDTGETFHASELNSRVPKGVDPSQLSKDRRRLDLGELVCMPVLGLIPPTMKPNTITYINHVANWMLLVMAAFSPILPVRWQMFVLCLCAVVNFLCMMLDCLDGMHARATNQTSKLGEVLDHWFDAIHVPMVCGGVAFALQFSTWALTITMVLQVALYGAQLIVYHYQRVFLQTSGVEGQALTSLIYIWAATLASYPDDHYLVALTRTGLSVIGPVTMIKLSWYFITRMDRVQLHDLGLIVAVCSAFAALCIVGILSRFEFLLVISFISFRVIGSYVVDSVLQRPHPGIDPAIYHWLIGIILSHFVAEPIPIRTFFSRLVPLIGDWSFDSDVHQLLPYGMCVDLGLRNVAQFIKAKPRFVQK
eukprot:TRINITY_DN53261_c0_g1_i1.p1 TRINITY_DN53261_c0_g1~~TRINITY_DN53261_c0_g1_i1.p1  ORF type:complete len:389 (-),score=180.53 TRINITY_DN53261_c0_g1_i1:144-1310(-)